MKMKKLLSLALTLMMLMAFALPTLAHAEEEKVLNVFTWETYLDQDTILAPFTAETGIKINYATFSSNEEMLTKLQASGGADYDIILASDYMLDAARQENLLQPLDMAKIPNFKNLKPGALGYYFDPESKYVVPYIVGTPVIVYDPAVVDFEITGYEDLWNPALKDSVVVVDDARNIIGITLKTMGKSLNESDPAVLDQAAEKLAGLRPNIRAFDYNSPHELMISGETSVGYMFTSFAVLAHEARPDLKVVHPKEGIGIGIDGLVIPVKAPHPENAHLFLDFLLRPEIGAQIGAVQKYNCVNAAAEPLLPDFFKSEPALNVPSELLERAEMIQFLSDVEPKYQEIWTEFKQK